MKKGFTFEERRTRKGFTLIELLVVISIIGILASLTFVSYSGAQKQTRDTQRRSDLAQYRNGLANFAASNNGLYPCTSGAHTIVDGAGICLTLTTDEFISSCLLDPQNDSGEVYKYITDGCGTGSPGDPVSIEYILWAKLETGGYWLVCSDGRSGKYENAVGPTDSNCESYL